MRLTRASSYALHALVYMAAEKHNRPIPHEEVLAELGLTTADWETMGQEPLPEETPHRSG